MPDEKTPLASPSEPRMGRCLGCDYILFGLKTPRCPECGRPFDPSDPKTMNMGPVLTAFQKRLVRPPGWIINLAAAIMYFVLFWFNRFGLKYIVLWPILIVAGIWLAKLLSAWVIYIWKREPTRRVQQKWGRWLVVPILAGVGLLAIWFQTPLLFGLMMHHRAFQDRLETSPRLRIPEEFIEQYPYKNNYSTCWEPANAAENFIGVYKIDVLASLLEAADEILLIRIGNTFTYCVYSPTKAPLNRYTYITKVGNEENWVKLNTDYVTAEWSSIGAGWYCCKNLLNFGGSSGSSGSIVCTFGKSSGD